MTAIKKLYLAKNILHFDNILEFFNHYLYKDL